jgi:glutamine amidotransferase
VTLAAVIDYDLGNLPSVTKALERIGVDTVIVDSSDGFDDSLDAVVLPGVGHFGAGARNLRDRGLDAPLKEWARAGKPLLGICVGLQLFFERSEEDSDATGLGIVDGEVRRLKAAKVPLMGWTTLEVAPHAKVLDAVEPEDMAYFVHSYYVDPDPAVVAATTNYEHDFCSAIEMDNVVGVQFHPEKSAEVGRKVLQRFFDVVVG